MIKAIKIFFWFCALMLINSLSFGQVTVLPGNARGLDRVPGFTILDTGLYLPFHNLLPWSYRPASVPDYFRIGVSPYDSLPYYVKVPYDSTRFLLAQDTPWIFKALNLQRVTDNGDTTTNHLVVVAGSDKSIIAPSSYTFGQSLGILSLVPYPAMLGSFTQEFQADNGTIALLTNIPDTTWLHDNAFLKPDSNTHGNATTFDLVADTAAAIRAAFPVATLTSVTATSPLSVNAATGPLTINIIPSGVSAGTYTNATVTVNATGLITGAASGSAGTVISVTFNATSNAGSDITSTVNTATTTPAITLNIPTASGSQRGALSSTDWTTFNNKGSGTVTSVGEVAGTGISIGGTSTITTAGTFTVTNTAPDQTVVLNSGTGISATGTYPNFTITNTSPSIGGTVTAFSALSLNPIFTTGVSNSTTTPALSFALISQSANVVFAGPSSGGAANPTFRSLVAADLPAMVNSIASSDASLTVSAATGAATINMAATNPNPYTWTALQTISTSLAASTQGDGILLSQPTAATSGNPRYSPSLHLQGRSFNTTAGASQSSDLLIYGQTASSPSPATSWLFQVSTNGSAYATQMTIGTSAGVSFSALATCGQGITISAAKKLTIGTGTNAIVGTATLSSGTVTVSATTVTASSLIWVQYQSGQALSIGVGTASILRVSTQTPSTSFVIVADLVTTGATNTTDNSPVQYWIIN